jgi:hypothetical protein
VKKLFPQTIKKSRLLYRARENKFEMFRDYCKHFNNLFVVILTKSGHVCGGYSAPSLPTYEKYVDNTNRSFLFSLTNNYKAVIKEG